MKKSILYISICSLTACSQPSQTVITIPEVKVITPEKPEQNLQRSYTFISTPFRVTDLSFRVGGPIHTFNIQNGQFLQKGELIAALDDRDFILRKQRIAAIYQQADADFQRMTHLYQENNVSGMNYEKAQADYRKAKADYETAVNELNDTRLYAPFDGYVQQTYTECYQDIKPSMPVLTLIDLTKIKAEAYVPEDIALRYKKGMKSVCSVTFNALQGQKFHPTDTYLTQSVTDNNISYLFTAILDNHANHLFGGMAGSLNISYPNTAADSTLTEILSIPQAAVCHNEETGTFVWRVNKNNRVNKVPVKTGKIRKNNQIEILSGITPNDRIAVTQLFSLTENDSITVQN